MIKKNNSQINIYLLIFLTFIIHLVSLNFYPTNFEGGYGEYADFFNTIEKLNYLESYYNYQFNTYLFSGLASVLNKLLPIINGFQSVKILSAIGYVFLGLGIVNILKFYEYKNNYLIFVLIIFLNSIIWNYGHRSFNDLFAFSIGIFFFSRILLYSQKKIIYFDALFLGIAAAIKSYNLILLFPILIFFYSKVFKNQFKLKIFLITALIFLPFIIINILTHKYLGFLLAPKNEDLQIAIFGKDESRNIFWVLNNFIFYIGYMTLISFPFILKFFFEICKNKKKNSIFLIFLVFFSFLINDYFFISSELDLGPLQKYINPSLYKTTIIFCFLFFSLIFYYLKKNTFLNENKIKICMVIIYSIILYFLALSFIKASQRYLILPLPFFFLIVFNVIQPRFLVYLTLTIYLFLNSILLLNYYVTGKSTEMILNFLDKNDILGSTVPGVMMPNVYHLYNINYKIKYRNDSKITVFSSNYKITNNNPKSIFSSKVKIFGYEFKKYSVIKIK